LCASIITSSAIGQDFITYEAQEGQGEGKHVVFISGDEEYRSEEGLPMLAKILSQRHGFKCTVLFSVDDAGNIDPNNQASLTGAEALDSADCIVMLIRFRNWPDDQMQHFVEAFHRGVPIVALRTSTHAFLYGDDHASSYRDFNSFGERVLGEEWVSHWGRHKEEATLGVIEPGAEGHPILRGASQVFGDTDVYEAYPPEDATILLRGQVLEGMQPTDPPADYTKRRASDRQEQNVNDPMMPVAWTRTYKNEAGNTNRIFVTTLGAATDLAHEGTRRLVVNAVYWALDMEGPRKADVQYVGEYEPTMYGFGGFQKGVKPAEHALDN
jgi:hypothetical protein